MAAYNLSPIGNWFSNFGSNTSGSTPNLPLASGKLWTYQAGTSTPTPVYTTNLGVAWSNPIILGADGRVPGQIWQIAGGAIKYVLQDSLGNPIETFDNIVGINDTTGYVTPVEWATSGVTPIYSAAGVFTTTGNTTAIFQIGRRIQATVTAGTVYGTVVSAVFGVATTVTLDMDQGQALDNGLTVVNVGFLGTTGVGVSVPMNWRNDLTLRNLTATGTIGATGVITGSGGFSGNLTGNVTGNVVGTATGLSGASPALGTNWNIDANGQLVNNGNTTYMAAFASTALTTAGQIPNISQVINQQGSNFSILAGTVTILAAGVYEILAYIAQDDPGVANLTPTMWFDVGASASITVYGPNATYPQPASIPGASGSVNSWIAMHAWLVATAASQTIAVKSSVAYSANYRVNIGSNIIIRQIA